mmetsp:Transcript_63278/g.184942  ORF Transcript_63278/g.184942 Transcript_63278/m.184942 type:complete len:354 (+) Transcript_63278:353-1414(+)
MESIQPPRLSERSCKAASVAVAIGGAARVAAGCQVNNVGRPASAGVEEAVLCKAIANSRHGEVHADSHDDDAREEGHAIAELHPQRLPPPRNELPVGGERRVVRQCCEAEGSDKSLEVGYAGRREHEGDEDLTPNEGRSHRHPREPRRRPPALWHALDEPLRRQHGPLDEPQHHDVAHGHLDESPHGAEERGHQRGPVQRPVELDVAGSPVAPDVVCEVRGAEVDDDADHVGGMEGMEVGLRVAHLPDLLREGAVTPKQECGGAQRVERRPHSDIAISRLALREQPCRSHLVVQYRLPDDRAAEAQHRQWQDLSERTDLGQKRQHAAHDHDPLPEAEARTTSSGLPGQEKPVS